MSEIFQHFPGRLRLYVEALQRGALAAARIRGILSGVRGIANVEICQQSGILLTFYDPGAISGREILDVLVAGAVVTPTEHSRLIECLAPPADRLMIRGLSPDHRPKLVFAV